MVAMATFMVVYSPQYFEPDCSLGYLARRVNQIGSVALEPIFASEGLTGPQWSALAQIWFRRGATSAELARDMAHDKGAMTRLVDTLEANGWITRERCSDDRRAVKLALTPEGEALALRVRLRVIDCWNAWLADWDEGEVETMIAMMQKLRDTLLTKTSEGVCS
jgi:DNA-binding MarR family transcriptional regulator